MREAVSGPVVIDSRYDADNILTGTSRRLVDVCTELNLDVTQPELFSTSMTALHRVWLTRGDASARERITVLNLRHGLSAAYVALASADLARWDCRVNVNQVLDRQLIAEDLAAAETHAVVVPPLAAVAPLLAVLIDCSMLAVHRCPAATADR